VYTFNVTLNDARTPRADPSPAGAPKPGPASSPSRQELADELLDALTAWRPRDWLQMFKRWQRGSLSLIHLNVIAILEGAGPRSMSQLAEATDVSVASMTGIVTRMEQRGLVERQRTDDDRRVVLVALSPRGARVLERVELHRRERLARLLDELDEEQMAGFLSGLRGLHAARARMAELEPPGTDMDDADDADESEAER
jgi:DNA-binding MarR family transcriptional regulator